MAAEGMQSHDQSCGNCPTASHPATKKGRINAPILPKPARGAKSDRLLGGIDIIVDVLGGSNAPGGGFAALDDTEWRKELKQNLMPAVSLDRAMMQSKIEQGSDV